MFTWAKTETADRFHPNNKYPKINNPRLIILFNTISIQCSKFQRLCNNIIIFYYFTLRSIAFLFILAEKTLKVN